MDRRYTLYTLDNGATWIAERFGGPIGAKVRYEATNIPTSLLNKINAQLNAMTAQAGYNPQMPFIECRVRPKGVPENAGQRNSKATVMLNFRDGGEHKQLREDFADLIVTNQEFDSLTWIEQ